MTPIAGGFPTAQIIPNAASIRVTKSGLEFLGGSLPSLATKLLGTGNGGVIDYGIPSTSTSIVGSTLSICQNGENLSATPPQCVAEIAIGRANLAINAVTPNLVSIGGTVPLRIPDLIVGTAFGDVDVGVGSGLSCDTTNGGVAGNAGFLDFPITIQLPLVPETDPSRAGYMMVGTPVVTTNITSSDLIACCTTTTPVIVQACNGILSLLSGAVASALQSDVPGLLQNTIQSKLCTAADPALDPPCPVGSSPQGGDAGSLEPDGAPPANVPNCIFDSNPDAGICVPTELGLEGHINLGALLASISPGTSGALDFALAAYGSMNPAPGAAADSNGNTPNGMTLGMFGGGLAAPVSPCVPDAGVIPLPQNLVIPDQMLTDTVTGYGADAGPDLGVAMDGQFLNYFLGSAYTSGLLCLGVTTEKFQQLSTGLFSLILPSVKHLTFEQKAAALAITTRPRALPQATLGGGTDPNSDPLLSILLPSFALDFYVWSDDRYVRMLTFTGDVTIPMNIQSSSAGIQPVLGNLAIANAAVTNEVLISEPPATVATALSGVLTAVVGQVLGAGIPAINPGSALASYGLSLTIPPGGITRIQQATDAGTESYLGLFANLGVAGAQVAQIDTTAAFVGKTIHADAMQMETFQPTVKNEVQVRFGSPADDGAGNVEYSWQLDQGTFSAWSTQRDVTVRDPMLWMQAKHTLQVTARLVGVPASQDPTPAVVPFAIDVLPPSVELTQNGAAWSLSAWDIVSPADALVARTRTSDATGKASAWTDWQPLASVTLPASATSFDVQVRDEEGNVGSTSSALIRGGNDPTLPPSGGCSSGCTTAAHAPGGGAAVFVGVAGVSLLFARRRRSRRRSHLPGGALLALGSIVTVAATNEGCSCGHGAGAESGGLGDASADEGGHPEGGLAGTPHCGSGCTQLCGSALEPGMIGAYTSIAQASDGTLWVAGYDDSAYDPSKAISAVYGDLVVGKYDTTSKAVGWVTVDGLPAPLPAGTCPPNDPTGWRGGRTEPGPDVGLWTSLALDASGHPMVAYYDATNQQLKFASSPDGVTWATHVIYTKAGSDAGRYAKMIVVNGNPIVAYLVIETGTNGYSRTRVSLAHASKPLPAAASDWAVEDALVDETTPCRAQDCTATQACLIATGVCTTVSMGCDATCASGEACIESSGVPSCQKVAQSSDIHPYPNAVGDYLNLSALKSGLGLAVYDRIHGNLLGLTNTSGAWTVTVLDGETGSRANGTAIDTGDDGVGASLFVAANGDWHVSYVDGITESLKYLYVPGGTLANNLVPQVVDTGYTVDGASFTDGMHIVGDDSNVRLNGDGTVSISYMDATAGTLRIATGTSSPGTWTLHALSQPNEFAGFFSHLIPGGTSIENYWRWTDATTQKVSGNVAIVTP